MDEKLLEELKSKALDDLAMNRQRLLMKYPFVGGILMRLDIMPVRDRRIDTAMTDGTHVYVDLDFYSTLSDEERVFMLAHEAWHCIFMHMTRLQNRDRLLFNIATDMEINQVLKSDGLKLIKGVLLPEPNMVGKSAEEIYEILLMQQKKNQKMQGMSKDSNEFGMPGNNSSGNSQSNSKTNKKNKSLSGQFDSHKYSEDIDNDGSDSNSCPNCKDQWGEVGLDPDFKPTIDQDLTEKLREMVITEAELATRTAGGLPGALEAYLETLKKPEISWKEALAQFVTSCYNGKRRWLPPSRRHIYNEIYLQSRRDEKLKIAVAIDTSGSCIEDLPKFFGELIGLLNSFGNYELTLIQNDYTISRVDTYDSNGNPFPEDPNDIIYEGGGGTSFAAPFEWVKENNPDINCFVFLTDGYEYFCNEDGTDMGSYDQPPYPVLWVLTKDGNKDFCDWGQKIYFEDSTYESN